MKNRALGSFALAAALMFVACSESHTGDDDASIIIDLDGAMLDGGPIDAGSMPGNVGSACSAETDCTGSADTCLSDPDFLPGGYCTLSCTEGGGECPDGSSCLQIDRTQAFCFDDCDPGATTRECRADYGCAQAPGVPNICVGGCTENSDCPDGLECDPSGGSIGAGSCFDPSSTVGDPCSGATECPSGAFCLAEDFNGWPAGSCIATGCDSDTNTGCDGDAQCLPSGGGGDALCIDGCATATDCRAGYECRGTASYPTRLSCQPGCTAPSHCSGGNVCNPALGTCDDPFEGPLGNMCSNRTGGCEGGTCLTEGTTGFPFAYCAYVGCTIGTDSTCPTGGACAPGAGGDNICLDACAVDGDCRAAYACRPVGTAKGSSLACLPACTLDTQCANRERSGFECNIGTGLCGEPFAGTVGEPCTNTDDDCTGGRCLTIAEGWPAGTCAAVGCSLDVAVMGEACPTGSTCVDDAAGRAEVGYCLDSCTVGAATGCRTGYTCTEITAGVTEGVCRPSPAVPPTP